MHASPSVRQLAREYQVELSVVVPSGPNGRITKQDVEQIVNQRDGSDAPQGSLQALTKVK